MLEVVKRRKHCADDWPCRSSRWTTIRFSAGRPSMLLLSSHGKASDQDVRAVGRRYRTCVPRVVVMSRACRGPQARCPAPKGAWPIHTEIGAVIGCSCRIRKATLTGRCLWTLAAMGNIIGANQQSEGALRGREMACRGHRRRRSMACL